MIQIFSTDGANQSFDEGVGHRHAGKGFNLVDSQNSQIRLPLVEPKHGVMIGAEPLGQSFSACGLMEQTAQRYAIHGRGRVDPEPDDPTRALVHDDEDPMGLESKGLTPEEINAPQTVLHVANEGQPRGSVGSVRVIVGGEDPSHDIFIER